MKKVYYNKLVRDGVEEQVKAKGKAVEIRTITDAHEFEQELFKKVSEEAYSLAHTRSKKEFLERYADLVVVLETLAQQLGFSAEDLQQAVADNREQKGAFEKRSFLHWSDDDTYKSSESPQGVSFHEKK